MKKFFKMYFHIGCKICISILFVSQLFGSTITGDNVNVRNSDSTTSDFMHKLSKGESVIIVSVGKKESIGKWGEQYWYEVSFSPADDTFWEGWVFGAFVETKVFGKEIQLRSKASSQDGKIVDTLKKGAVVKVVGVSKEMDAGGFPVWLEIVTKDGKKGWVKSNDLN